MLRAADGQFPVDPSITKALVTRLSTATKTTQSNGLSSRQQEILRMVADGIPTKEIESQLFISEATVKRDFRKIFDLLGVNFRAQAVAEAYRRKLI